MILDKKWLAMSIAGILLDIFNDHRIIHPKTKEIIIQGVTLYLTNPKSVVTLQSVAERS